MTDDHAERQLEPERAGLRGEAAAQQVEERQAEFPIPRDEPEGRIPGQAVYGDGTTYYDQPAIKSPVWIWSVPAYFHTGGVAAGASLIAAVAHLVDREGYARLIRSSRWLATGGTALGTVFLIVDLGRPARFLNMLRVFRPTSAMSVGSWALAASSATSAASVVLPLTAGRAGRVLGDVAGFVSGALAPALGTYTAVLVSDTAVPVWQATRRSLPGYFGASSLVAATAALDLLPLDERSHAVTHRLGVVAKAAELAAGERVEHDADEVPRVGRPLHEGVSGALWRAAKFTTGASLALSVAPVPARWRHRRRTLSAVLATVGSLAARFAVFHAGRASARDPRATFEQQRAGRGAAESDGRSGIVGTSGRRATDAG